MTTSSEHFCSIGDDGSSARQMCCEESRGLMVRAFPWRSSWATSHRALEWMRFEPSFPMFDRNTLAPASRTHASWLNSRSPQREISARPLRAQPRGSDARRSSARSNSPSRLLAARFHRSGGVTEGNGVGCQPGVTQGRLRRHHCLSTGESPWCHRTASSKSAGGCNADRRRIAILPATQFRPSRYGRKTVTGRSPPNSDESVNDWSG
jgi:hypothetical protein